MTCLHDIVAAGHHAGLSSRHAQFCGAGSATLATGGGYFMEGIVGIVVVVLIVLFVLGYFRRGSFRS
jgi:hypothetical protein